MSGSIHVVGIGPGDLAWCAPGAVAAIENASVIVGYRPYLNQIAALCPDTPRFGNGMRQEVERAREALRLAAEGRSVAVVSGGDAGVYGMAGLILQLAESENAAVEIEILPGITALTAAAAILGAPLMNDFAAISLSDCLTPADLIFRRLRAAAAADFVLCLYNPTSTRRRGVFEAACSVLIEELGENRPVGLVRAACRPTQSAAVFRLGALRSAALGMDSIVIVGNSTTKIARGRMVTPRGYRLTEEAGDCRRNGGS